ncbi:Ras-like GTP binding protein [Elysia marginata]|uniref:Ras-like GTP binding protein n=1 Tax=Elysia marginata TaxID=1093978 RepID=A0AAV4GLR3_9GAST|nr:Ras-like GTP binding protein [Elysia marginata]
MVLYIDIHSTFDTTVDAKVSQIEVSLHLLVRGQEECEKIRPLCYRNTSVFLLCFDITNRASAENIAKKWHPEVWRHCPGISIVLVGTKLDLRQTDLPDTPSDSQPNTMVTTEEGKELASRIWAHTYMECSALSGQGVTDIFEAAVNRRKRLKKRDRSLCVLS